ncbi:MAG: hypothetical protein KAQ99_08185 [Candidatus Aureabacteria bacterium]|nr:hypothetical protein [Candidatus Auribacterota bacterium]
MKKLIITLLLGAAFCGTCLFPEDVLGDEKLFSSNCVIAKGGKIRVVGTGKSSASSYYGKSQKKLMARRAALIDAYRNLARALAGFSGRVIKSGNIKSNGYIVGARCVETRYYKDGTVQIIMEMPGIREKRGCKREGIKVYNDELVSIDRKTFAVTEQEWLGMKPR